MDIRIFPRGYVLSLLEKLVHEFRKKSYFSHDFDHCFIYIPHPLKEILVEEFKEFGFYQFDSGELVKFRGYKILPGYEYGRIIICHDRYPQYNDDSHFHSINIVESVDLKEKPHLNASPQAS